MELNLLRERMNLIFAKRGLNVEFLENGFDEFIHARIEREFYGERIIDDVECVFKIEVPADFWQHFKQDYFPAFLKKHFPVKYREIKEVKFVRFSRNHEFKIQKKTALPFIVRDYEPEIYTEQDYKDRYKK